MTPPVNSPAIKVVKSVREQVSAEEWQTRVDLAACYRLTAMYGMTEMIANHISCRVPGIARPFPDQPLRDALRGNRRILPDQGRPRRQHAVQRLRLWRQRRRLRHSQRHSHGPARCRLRRAYPHAGRHGGLGDGMRIASAGADLDAVSPHRLSRLRRHRRRCRRARAAGGRPRRSRSDDSAQPRTAGGRTDHTGDIQPAVSHGARLRGAGDGAVLQHQAGLPAAGRSGSRPSTR